MTRDAYLLEVALALLLFAVGLLLVKSEYYWTGAPFMATGISGMILCVWVDVEYARRQRARETGEDFGLD